MGVSASLLVVYRNGCFCILGVMVVVYRNGFFLHHSGNGSTI